MPVARKPFEGTWNIVRFNWHYYILSLAVVLVMIIFRQAGYPSYRSVLLLMSVLVMSVVILSLAVSWYIYDFSNLYRLDWLDNFLKANDKPIVNVNAGFDEISHLLKIKFAASPLLVFDFYDQEKHTEASLRRARKTNHPLSGTQQIATAHVPLADNSVDKIFAIFSVHEIRNNEERVFFF